MFFIDLHIHSRYSRACSKDISIKNLSKYAKIKGLNLLGTGDFTHPEWTKELKQELVPAEDSGLDTSFGKGIYLSRDKFPFIFQTEISLIYTQDGKGRRIHNVIIAPDFETALQITDELKKRGRVDYDGRPIFKISCPDFVEMLRKTSPDIEVIPAHICTPYFSLFGEYNQFSKVEDCYKDQTKHIHSLETGMSSDPAMNYRLSQLDKYNLVSFSDIHSFWPWRIGREATILNLNKEISYKSILTALRTGENIIGTIETNPNYGIYHYTGHRNCNVCVDPVESKKLNQICPKCHQKMTIGVLERVEQLADRAPGFKPKTVKPFYNMIPLSEIISGIYDTGLATRKCWDIYNLLIEKFDNEFNILLNVSEEELAKVCDPKLVESIINVRHGKVNVKPGYDGLYGIPIFGDKEIIQKPLNIKSKTIPKLKEQKSLSEF